jgi:hypothetical protein
VQYGGTIRRIVEAVRKGSLGSTFSPKEVNAALGVTFAGTLLPKHRIGNPGGNTPLFIQLGRGRYCLNISHLKILGFPFS